MSIDYSAMFKDMSGMWCLPSSRVFSEAPGLPPDQIEFFEQVATEGGLLIVVNISSRIGLLLIRILNRCPDWIQQMSSPIFKLPLLH